MSTVCVRVILGSASDRRVLDESEALEVLRVTGVGCELSYISAHRNLAELTDYVVKERKWVHEDPQVVAYIAAAGMSAALPGVIASLTLAKLPVIGVPLPSTEYPNCEDSLLSMVRMPPGMPVLVPGVGKSGLKNAAIAAAQICALLDSDVADALQAYILAKYKLAEIDILGTE